MTTPEYITGPGYRELDHTADLALEFWASTEEELLLVAARALVEILTDGASLEGSEERKVHLQCGDREDRLVRWLNEVLFLAIAQEYLVMDAQITLHEGGLNASLIGAPASADAIRTELKSVTYHGLQVVVRPGGFSARVVVDV